MLDQIQSILKDQYHLQGLLTNLPGDEDLNFKLDGPDNQRFTVKLMRSSCPEDLIELQTAVLKHLEPKGLEVQLPAVIDTSDKRPYLKVNIDQEERIFWVLTWCPGNLYAHFHPKNEGLLHSFGQQLGLLTTALQDFDHPKKHRLHRWALSEALEVKDFVQYIREDIRPIAEGIFDRFENITLQKLNTLPHQIIHNDANDYNVLVEQDDKGKAWISGIFDFGDIAYQPAICELAIAIAYAIMDQPFPLRTASKMVSSFHEVRPLSLTEIDLLLDLIKLRLAVSVAISSQRQRSENDPYITISQAPALAAIQVLNDIPKALADASFRQACNFEIVPQAAEVMQFIRKHRAQFHLPIKLDSWEGILDLSVGSLMLGADPRGHQLDLLSQKIDQFSRDHNFAFTIGRYLESRRLYAAANFGAIGHPALEKRTQHLGLDIFGPAGTPVHAPLDGKVIVNTIVDLPLDYGGLLVLEHQTNNGTPFYTLYGHLAHDSLKIAVGNQVIGGQQIACLGAPHENGGWPPHLHWQFMIDLVGLGKEFPGVAYAKEVELWSALSPNPMELVDDIDPEQYNARVDYDHIYRERKEKLGYNLSLTYSKPLHIVAGFRQFLFDSHANTYLDFYNNVPHVGHQHPTVVKAIQDQAALLNTNTRYLHENILHYAERLCAKLPDELEICYFVNSASEANELAIRMARVFTKRNDIMVVEAAYHGHTNTLIDISPYKHDGPGGSGTPDWVHKVPIADDYRGKFKRAQGNTGSHYAEEVAKQINTLESEGKQIAAFIAETYPSVGGQIITPPGYLKEVYQHLRAHGALCIADEVQTGFGRLGKSFWAFETQDAIPDMIVLGKPIGNGFPLAAVVTTKAIAEAFHNGMEYFSTYGGNPVACAAGLAVLDVIEAEQLQLNAQVRGAQITSQLRELQKQFPIIGDVRGEGLFLGIELVKDQVTLEPAAAEAQYVIDRLKDHHILAGTDGPLHNVIKIRPSMVINETDVEYFFTVFTKILGEDFLR